MKTKAVLLICCLLLISSTQGAQKNNPVHIIVSEPVTMMDLGILRLNTSLGKIKQPGLNGAALAANYNEKHGTIDIKVSMPVKKASRSQCKSMINSARKIFLKPFGKKEISNIHHYFQHEGSAYKKRIDWNDLANHVVISGIVLTRKNFQDSVYCQGKLMHKKVTF